MYALVFTALFLFEVNGALYKTPRFQSFPLHSDPLQKNVQLEQSFSSGIQTFGPAGGSFYEANGVAISQINGKTDITINGMMVDLLHEPVVKETSEFRILEPAKFPGARITINKLSGQIRVDYGTTHVQTQTLEEAEAKIAQSITQMQDDLKRERENLNNIFTGFPFFRGSRSIRKKRF